MGKQVAPPRLAAAGKVGAPLRLAQPVPCRLGGRDWHQRPFTQEDPIGLAGGLNLYGFADGDPVNFTDPFGLCPWCFETLALSLSPIKARGEGRDVVITYCSGAEQLRSGGTRSWRNNNPGNLRNTGFSERQGSIGEAGGFAVFGNAEVGHGAVIDLLGTESYQSLSLNDAIARYAPASENNTWRYQAFVRGATGIEGGTTLNTLSAAQTRAVADAITMMEGWREGIVSWRWP